ncbi:MAG: HAMP domain-containing histidine kinase [Ignavibacteria bacterium]|jgi:signal transduction histidine kinase|nr:HAMP domain-containing histidine kinase [Ignavibacteria bacterium]MCU7500835.1 HAMP domain-containing histidine kinase [Ignavibacteria bacterium]MCU7513450.1 HAMP domain-containing histidine kinase [Ignavibacteria bacterium]MCU7521711.1 HAMP domain-containing histidine kinase [Ignavibacteria bacterium]MCU7525394.1 HAMP domain-containing histidine kinase [Ignavibacteria bacterium]
MISLIPSWAGDNPEFWVSVKKRNLWLIKLRYGAVAMLVAMLLGLQFIMKLPLTHTQAMAYSIITLSILFYNACFHYFRRFIKPEAGRFHALHLSLLQMLFDLAALMLLVHYGGGIENPLYMFFIFHMIIGSLILPGFVIYTISGGVVLLFSLLVFSEYLGLLAHHGVYSLFMHPVYNNLNFIIVFLIVFSVMMFVSVTIANKIAHELYRREQDLIETLKKLNLAEIEKQKYIMGVVHEIKTPVAAVQSYLDLVLGSFLGPVAPEVSERLLRARKRTEETIRMINNILRLSKLKLLNELSEEEIKMDELLCGIIDQHRAMTEQKHINVVLKDERKIKKYILADRELLEVAFSNLLGNSIKYIGSEGKIEILLLDNDDVLTVNLCDNGIGIPESELNKIFEEFYRGSNIKHGGYEGSGMGLSVVKQIIERHKGTISVESPSRLATQGKPGACFKVTLPLEMTS